MRALGLDLDGDGDIDPVDVRALPREKAVEIYVEHYFRRPKLHLLPTAIQPSVLDMQVNAGSNAVKILQRLMATFGSRIRDDGVIGPATIRAVTLAMSMAPDHLVDAYGIARRNYYYRLADRRPASRKFARARSGGKGGWIKRAEEFIAAKFHLSDAEHETRVAAWD